jgi:hypothetical protein
MILRQSTANRSARLHSARGSLPPLVFRTVRATFAAHGSSVDRTLVMSTSPRGEFVTSTVYLVMTVTMNCRKVEVPVIGAISIQVMDFDQVIRREAESARLAAPLLLLHQRRQSPRYAWVLPPPCRPIPPVPVIRAGLPLHFDVSHNRHARVLVEGRSLSLPKLPALAWRGIPVAADDPPPTFARVPEKRPSSELLIESVVEPMEGLRADDRPIVVGPASDDRVQHPTQVRLLGRLVLADQRRQPRPVAFHPLWTWLDEGFEATSPRRVVLARVILANLEAKKVAACFAFSFVKGMGDAGLLFTQLQSDAPQPFLRQLATLLNHGSVSVEYDQVVGVPDDLGWPMALTARLFWVPSRPGWKPGPDVRFKSVQGDVGQQWRDDSSYKVANFFFLPL